MTFALSSTPTEPMTLTQFICMILVTFLDTGVILCILREKRRAKSKKIKNLLVIFAIIAAALLLSPSVAACPSHFTFKFVE